jgi:hypothetical protein
VFERQFGSALVKCRVSDIPESVDATMIEVRLISCHVTATPVGGLAEKKARA